MTTQDEYRTWRQALHELQIKIDESTEAFWVSVTDNEGNLIVRGEDFKKAEADHKIEHQKLLDELETHHQKHPGYPDPE